MNEAPTSAAKDREPAARLRMLISDIDGTLVTKDKRLTPAVVEAVKRLRAAGLAFGVVSSRPPRGMKSIVDTLGLTQPVAAFNGGAILDASLRPISPPLTLSPQAAAQSVSAIAQAGADCWLFTSEEWLVRGMDGAYVGHETRTVGFSPRVVDSFDPYLGGAAKIVGASADFERLRACESALSELLGTTASASRSQNYYLDVTHPEANKGRALRELSRLAGVSIAETAAIGDMVNDLAMLSIAGLAIAMGNAPDTVKQQAHFTTASNEESGFASAVERYVLPRIATPL